jgi:hypothetical protein
VTLLIALILIEGQHLDDGWRYFAVIVWIAHMYFHRASDLRKQVKFVHDVAKAALKERTGRDTL